MIGIDTNVIIRFILRDDESQFALAKDLMAQASADQPLCVNVVTLVEVVWVLESRLRLEPILARSMMEGFISSAEIFIPDTNPFPNPLTALASSHRGWTDVVVARINQELGCSFTYTFDKRAARDVSGMELLQ